MRTHDPEIPDYRDMAAMWAYGVLFYGDALKEAVDQFQKDQLDSRTRRHFKDASEEDRAVWAEYIAEATDVLTIASTWRMFLARNTFLNAAAQLRKCAVGLGDLGVTVPQIR